MVQNKKLKASFTGCYHYHNTKGKIQTIFKPLKSNSMEIPKGTASTNEARLLIGTINDNCYSRVRKYEGFSLL